MAFVEELFRDVDVAFGVSEVNFVNLIESRRPTSGSHAGNELDVHLRIEEQRFKVFLCLDRGGDAVVRGEGFVCVGSSVRLLVRSMSCGVFTREGKMLRLWL